MSSIQTSTFIEHLSQYLEHLSPYPEMVVVAGWLYVHWDE